MIYYPILQLKEMGITEIMIVSGRGHAGHFLELLGSGNELGVNLMYDVQEEAGGIAQALALTKTFVGEDKFVVILGDNIFEDDLSEAVSAFEASDAKAHVFLKEVDKPQSYGVVRFEGDKVVEILEKPQDPPSPYAVTGCYCYTPEVYNVITQIKPSARGEMEISDVNDHYVKRGEMSHSVLDGYWGDCGESIDGMMAVAQTVQQWERN